MKTNKNKLKLLKPLLIILPIITTSSCKTNNEIFTKTDLKKETIKIINTETKEIKSEKLLQAKGHWNLVEKSSAYDPQEAHLQARKNVNTKRRNKRQELTAHFKPDAKSGQDINIRILRLEPSKVTLNKTDKNKTLLQKPITTQIDTSNKKINQNINTITPPPIPKRKKTNHTIVNNNPNINIKVDKITKSGGNKTIIPKRKPETKINKNTNNNDLSKVHSIYSYSHSGNERIVIEVSNATKYKIGIDKIQNVFKIKMKDTLWDISQNSNFTNSKILSHYTIQKDKNNYILLKVKLKKPSKIIKTQISRNIKTQKHYIMIDIKPL